MTEGEKKPPIKVSELHALDNSEEKKPGGLSYVAPGASASGSGGKWAQVLVPALLAVIVTLLAVFLYAPSKGDVRILDSNIREVAGQTDAAITGIMGDVDTAVAEARSAKDALGNYVTKDALDAAIDEVSAPDLAGYVTEDELADAVNVFLNSTTNQQAEVSLDVAYGSGFTFTVTNNAGGTVYFHIEGVVYHEALGEGAESPLIGGFDILSGGDRFTNYLLSIPGELSTEEGSRTFTFTPPAGDWYHAFNLVRLNIGEGEVQGW